ncbi:hypothetical protein AEAC466_14610 [Asticcacaulis sp. AC466]|nr:hypothetical protein AEAC466_14610 [Asticcacaulis sp. AC466]
MLFFENDITKALCIYIGYGKHSYPGEYLDDLTKKFGPKKTSDLLPRISAIRVFANNIPFEQTDSLQKIAKKN